VRAVLPGRGMPPITTLARAETSLPPR